MDFFEFIKDIFETTDIFFKSIHPPPYDFFPEEEYQNLYKEEENTEIDNNLLRIIHNLNLN